MNSYSGSTFPTTKLGDLWWKIPIWLSNISLWSRQPTISLTTKSQVESKVIKDIMTRTTEKSDLIDKLFEKNVSNQFLKIQ